MKQSIEFIINPISGGKDKSYFPELIRTHINASKFDVVIRYTEYAGHARELAKTAVENNTNIVVAVGGDGTINEIGSELVHSNVALAVIPTGSGNGLARHLQIPINTIKALQFINAAKVTKIDVGSMNGRYFFCTSGVGFDAHIAQKFAGLSKRGLQGYIKTSLQSFIKYKAESYYLRTQELSYQQDAFMITFANAAQFGNNAYIAPLADIKDGLLDICVMTPYAKWKTLLMGYRLFAGTIHESDYMSIQKSAEVYVRRAAAGPAHIDGEPIEMPEEIVVSIIPQALRVIAGI